VYTTIVMTAEI